MTAMPGPRRGRRALARIALATATLALACLEGAAAAQDRPALVGRLEQQYDGAFLFATRGDGRYDLYEKVDAQSGLREADVVCLMHACYFPVGQAQESELEAIGGDSRWSGDLRRLMTAARDAYREIVNAPPEERAGRRRAWRERASRIAGCLAERTRCAEAGAGPP